MSALRPGHNNRGRGKNKRLDLFSRRKNVQKQSRSATVLRKDENEVLSTSALKLRLPPEGEFASD